MTDAGPVRVGLVSNEPIRRLGLASAFEGHPKIEIIATDLQGVLMDSSVPYLILDVSQESGWMESLLRVRKTRPDVRVIVVGPRENTELMVRSITAGARAYLDPSTGQRAVRQAVETAIEGYIWAPRRVLSMLVDRLLSRVVVAPAKAEVIAFSPRERQVLDLITEGNSNRQIAVELGIEERTVKAYVASLFRKVGVENRVSLSVQEIQKMNREKRQSLG